MLHKTIEKGLGIEDTATLFFLMMKIFVDKSLATWKNQIEESNFMKILGLLFVCIERLNQSGSYKDLPEVYNLFAGKKSKTQGKTLHPVLSQANSNSFYLWLWQGKFDDINQVVDILKQYPVFYRDINLLNQLSKRLNIQNFDKLEEDTDDHKNIQLFFNILSINFKRLVVLTKKKVKGYETIQKQDSAILTANKSGMIEFLDRVSRSNSKETKSFLIAIMKSLG
jgi:hypothetical protein